MAEVACKFQTWKTIKIGTYPSPEKLSRALADKNVMMEDSEGFLKDIALATVETKIELVRASPTDLGFNETFTRKEMNARAKKLGLEPVPAEVGPQLRLQYLDQPKDEVLIMAMSPIIGVGKMGSVTISYKKIYNPFISLTSSGNFAWLKCPRFWNIRTVAPGSACLYLPACSYGTMESSLL